MALTGQDLKIYLSVASGDGDPQTDPNASLGGFRSSTPLEQVEGSVDALAPNAFEFTSADLVNKNVAPSSPSSDTITQDSGSYVSSADLIHWYRLGFDEGDIGKDYVGTFDLDDVSNIDDTDVVGGNPGFFNNQGVALDFDNGGTEGLGHNTAGAMGFANAWSVAVWCNPDNVSGTPKYIVRVGTSTLSPGQVDSIEIIQENANLRVRIVDDTTAADQKERVFNSFFTASTWVHITVTWDGTTLTVYKDGSPVTPDSTPEDDSVTMSDSASRRLYIGSLRVTSATQEFDGLIHSVAFWDVELQAAEVSDIATFGDGPTQPTIDLSDAWVCFVTGSNALTARKIETLDDSTGRVTFAQEWGATPQAGDVYRLYTPQLLFDVASAAECAAGVIDHRCIWWKNETGVTVADVVAYFVPLDPLSTDVDIAVSDKSGTASEVPTIADEEDEPDLTTLGTPDFALSIPASFRHPVDRTTASESPRNGLSTNYANLQQRAMWLRRTVDALSRAGKAAWLVILEGSTTGGDPDPIGTAFILYFEMAGFTPNLEVEFDRTPRTFGGARITGRLTDADIGVAIEGIDMDFGLIAPSPGALSTPSPLPIATDEDGEVLIAYDGPDDEAEVGSSVQVEAKVNV